MCTAQARPRRRIISPGLGRRFNAQPIFSALAPTRAGAAAGRAGYIGSE